MGTEVLMRGTLREVIANIGSLTGEDFICAEGKPNWTASSPSRVVRVLQFTDLRSVGPMPDYFLEVFVAQQVLEDWSALHQEQRPSLEEMCETLIYYAQHDTFPPIRKNTSSPEE